MQRVPPPFFSGIYAEAKSSWEKLEADPAIAGPWWQLFRQVQSPRHVLSELLQNADDAGAEWVRVDLSDDHFVFEHDGRDFTEDELRSLCRFGCSNKSHLFTIGFRGVGFKSTFSLGSEVVLLTPTLAVCFHEKRFTLPQWLDEASESELTRITVRITKGDARRELEKNLKEWAENPISLVFFRHIRRFSINGRDLSVERLGVGPIRNSERLRLHAGSTRDLLLIDSDEYPFPSEAQEEIRQERFADEFKLPPCKVQIVLGLSEPQRVFVVLPGGVNLELPFSCNAPFIQDPARSRIKSPASSATNRWLLDRVGRLAGKAILEWLGNRELSLEERARAYDLLPRKLEDRDSLESDVCRAICAGLEAVLKDQPILLTTAGEIVARNGCLAPPRVAYEVWSSEEIVQVFGRTPATPVLASQVSARQREALRWWQAVDILGDDELLNQLRIREEVPRPAEHQRLLRLWHWVQERIGRSLPLEAHKSEFRLVPVAASPVLHRARDTVRLPQRLEHISEAAWAFLVSLVQTVDPEWLEYVERCVEREPKQEQALAARRLLESLRLSEPTKTPGIAEQACQRLFGRGREVSLEEHVQIAHLVAALDAPAPRTLRGVTRDGVSRPWGKELIGSNDVWVDELLPEEWQRTRVLHDDYFAGSEGCPAQRWKDWLASEKSGVSVCPPFSKFEEPRYSVDPERERAALEEKLRERGVPWPRFVPYVSDLFRLMDYDFAPELTAFWVQRAREGDDLWMRVFRALLHAPVTYWQSRMFATLIQVARNWREAEVDTEQPIPAQWVQRFRSLKCVPDLNGLPHFPSDLYLRNPSTEPLFRVEPFVHPELDKEATKPLLELLGVRTRPAGVERLLDRIRALAKAPDPKKVASEIHNQYVALDQALTHAGVEAIQAAKQAFQDEALILTENYEWARRGDVYLRRSDVALDVMVINPTSTGLKLWQILGVAEEPTSQTILQQLTGLRSGSRLEGRELERVRKVLGQFAHEIWQTCGHWLSVDNTWVPVGELKYRVTMQTLISYQGLFSSVKRKTANLIMLPQGVYTTEPFAALRDLSVVVEERPEELPKHFPFFRSGRLQQQLEWLQELGRQLRRLKLADGELQERVRSAAARLADTSLYTLSPDEELSLVPCIDGEPVGQAVKRDVLWLDRVLFVRGARSAKYVKMIVDELAKPFQLEPIREAIATCFDRSREFIAEYFETNFELEAQAEFGRTDRSPAGDGILAAELTAEGVGAVSELLEGEETQLREMGVAFAVRGRHARKVAEADLLFRRFMAMLGFRWDPGKQMFLHTDGSVVARAEKPFHWCRYNAVGEGGYWYWVTPKRWGEEPLILPAEVWEGLKLDPRRCGLVVKSRSNQPTELPGAVLQKEIELGRIRMDPAAYALRVAS